MMPALVAHSMLSAPRPALPVDTATQQRLDWLRRIACRTRAMPADDLFRACAVLGREGPQAADRYATALLRVLPCCLGRARFQVFQIGASERSFDEAWLLALLDAAVREDTTSLTFLLARRLPHHARRQVAFLIGNLARALDIQH